jgi:hypothetical protein
MVFIWCIERVFNVPQVPVSNKVFIHTTLIITQLSVSPLITLYRLFDWIINPHVLVRLIQEHEVNHIDSDTLMGLYGELLEINFWWESYPADGTFILRPLSWVGEWKLEQLTAQNFRDNVCYLAHC